MSPQLTAFEMLRREHRVIENLLDRLRELGERMLTGERVSPGTVRLGVGLLDAYLHRVHMHQFDVELWPEARGIADPECTVSLGVTRDNHTMVRQSARRLIELTSRWANGDAYAQDQVARGLLDLAAMDEATNVFEERHPFVCLASAMPQATQAHVGRLFEEHAGTKVALEANITRFLRASQVEE